MAAVQRGNDYLEGVSCVQPEREVCFAVGATLGVKSYYEKETVPVPFAESGSVTGVGETTATLHGGVNPNALEAKYYFEYGPTTSYGSKTAEASAGSGTSRVEESKAITGLARNTTYHYRLVATNSKGTAHGLDQTFKTPYWRVTATPNPSETIDSYLRATSCTAATACTAVGEYMVKTGTYMPMAERWNGSEWTLESMPNPSGAKTTDLYGVSCSSATACVAVGWDESTAGVYVSVVESWNGAEWQIQSTPEPTGTLNSLLRGVSCTSATACTAVGWYENSSGVELPWAARWNGTTWAVQSVSAPTEAIATYPYEVSCTSSTTCTMVGEYHNSSDTGVLFAERWNGTSWSVQSTPSPTGAKSSILEGVSCTASTTCMATGVYENSASVYVPLSERWNGTEWSLQTAPPPVGAKASGLPGLSCLSSTACIAVGYYTNSAGTQGPLAEYWNGTEWQIESPPTVEGPSPFLQAVSCTTSTSCAAAGATTRTLAEIYE